MFHRSIFQFHSVFDDAEYSYLHPYMFREYTPHMPTTAIRWGETCQDVHDRVISFMRHIMQQHGQDADARVLLVSHQCVINVILGEAQDHPFQMGQLCEVDICEWMERAHS
jgi:broad specificity phosphatase PhoE